MENNDLTKQLTEMEDWYRAVIFDSELKTISAKNIGKSDESEFKLESKKSFSFSDG